MMTPTEARQRNNQNGVRMIRRDGEYRVTLNEWPNTAQTEERAYYTDDLEDAVLTGGVMRRHHNHMVKLGK